MIESYQIARMRKGGEKQTLRGFNVIQLSVCNLTSENKHLELLGNSRNKFREDEIKIVNNTPFYSDDDNNLTLLKNYINSVGYIEVVLFRLQSDSMYQVNQNLNIINFDDKGDKSTENIFVQQYYSHSQYQSSILDVPHKAKFKNNTILSFTLTSNCIYNVTMFCGKNKGDVEVEARSYYDSIQDTITDCQHFVPSMDSGKKRILMLKK